MVTTRGRGAGNTVKFIWEKGGVWNGFLSPPARGEKRIGGKKIMAMVFNAKFGKGGGIRTNNRSGGKEGVRGKIWPGLDGIRKKRGGTAICRQKTPSRRSMECLHKKRKGGGRRVGGTAGGEGSWGPQLRLNRRGEVHICRDKGEIRKKKAGEARRCLS